MPMSEYERILITDAAKGKKQALKILLDLYRPRLVEVIEGELHSLDHVDSIINSVSVKAEHEIRQLQNPAEFGRMIKELTRAECADSQKNDRDVPPQGAPTAQSFASVAPFRPVMQNHMPAAQSDPSGTVPFRPAVQNHASAAPKNPSAAVPFRPVVLNCPTDASDPYAPPSPQNAVEYDSKTELLTEEHTEPLPLSLSADEAKTELLTDESGTAPLHEEAKTELLSEGVSVTREDEPKTELLSEGVSVTREDEVKTELLSEGVSVTRQDEAKTEVLSEGISVTRQDEEKTVLLSEEQHSEKTEESVTEPIPEQQGELLYKPDTMPRAHDQAPSNSPATGTAKVGLLVCVKGENTGENFSLYAGANRVGVSDDCDVQIKDRSLTDADHVFVIYDERRESFSLDPGSLSSRLFVNDASVDSPIFIQSHDTLRIGGSAFMLVSFQ